MSAPAMFVPMEGAGAGPVVAPVDTGAGALAGRLTAGDIRALSRAISLVENGSDSAQELLSACFPYTGKSLVVGITGSPGAGKSTLTHCLALALRARGFSVGVLAVDPTSPFSGGAILGDRIRMTGHENDSGLYVRSMATRGHLGGLSRTTADALTVLEAAGRDVILIETVGVGQDEVDIVRLADVTAVLLVPGMGDDVQSIKAGIMEIADVFVINKADRDGAARVEREVRTMQSLGGHHGPEDWIAPVVKTIASRDEGTGALLDTIFRFRDHAEQHGRLQQRRVQSWQLRLTRMLQQQFLEREVGGRVGQERLRRFAQQAASREVDPYRLVPQLLAELLGGRA